MNNGPTLVSFEEISTLVGLCFTLLTLVGTVFWYVHNSIRSVEKAATQKIELEIAKESKSRHDLSGIWSSTFDAHRRDLTQLSMEAARKTDLDKLEQRLVSAFDKAEEKRERQLTEVAKDVKEINDALIRLEAKADQRNTALNDRITREDTLNISHNRERER